MNVVKALIYVTLFIATWVVASRLMGQAEFHASDVVAMAVAAVGAYFGARWGERRGMRASA